MSDGNAIPLTEWFARHRANPTDADVPCGDCNACCRAGLFVHIGPDEQDTLKQIPKALLFAAPGLPRGHRLLGYNERGHCPMLRDGRCSIYAARPRTCREFDCRVFAITEVEPPGAHSQDLRARVKAWRIVSDDAGALVAALRAAACFLDDHRALLPAGFVPRDPAQRALRLLGVAEVLHGLENAKPDPNAVVEQVIALRAPFG